MSVTEEQMARLRDEQPAFARQIDRANALEESGVPPGLSLVMAGDLISAEDATARIEAGESTFEQEVVRVGSFARFGWTVEMQKRGHLTRAALLDQLPELWRGTDPDDTDGGWLKLWREAFARNGLRPVTDGRPLPKGPLLIVYRGQMPGDPLGIAWSLDPKIADKFAHGAGTRVPMNGTVLRGKVARSAVLAYLTGRGESEVIVDPKVVVL